MESSSVFSDLSDLFLNEEITKPFTRKRLLSQIRESIISKVVVDSAKDVFLKFMDRYKQKNFPYGFSVFNIPSKLNGKEFNVTFKVYNAKTKKELDEEFPYSFTGGSGYLDYGKDITVEIYVGLVNNEASNEKIYSVHETIAHELNHIYQQACRDSMFGHTGLMVAAKTNLFSGDINKYHLGVIAYIGDNSERQSFCNELYTAIMNHLEGKTVFSKNDCAAYIWLNNLQKAYQYILNNKGNILLMNAIEEFRKGEGMKLYNYYDKNNLERTKREHLSDYKKWTYSKFKSVANNTIQKFEDEIRYTVGKAITDAAEKGLLKRLDGRDYYSLFL